MITAITIHRDDADDEQIETPDATVKTKTGRDDADLAAWQRTRMVTIKWKETDAMRRESNEA